MRGTIVNTILFIIVIALLGLNWVLRSDPSRRNIEVMPDMAQSPAYASFGANENFRDGMTLRGPVPGTVIRGRMPLHYVATPADALRAGRELRSPFAPNDAKVLARGKVVFENYCMTCHGVHGTGDGTVAQRGYPTPASLIAPKAVQMANGQIFHVITYGQNNMPSLASVDAAPAQKASRGVARDLRRDRLFFELRLDDVARSSLGQHPSWECFASADWSPPASPRSPSWP